MTCSGSTTSEPGLSRKLRNMANWTELDQFPVPDLEKVLQQVGFPTSYPAIPELVLRLSRQETLSTTAGFPRSADPAIRSIELEIPDYLWDRAIAWIAHGGSLTIDGPVGSGKTMASLLLAAVGISVQRRQAKKIGGLPESFHPKGPTALYMTETQLLQKVEAIQNAKGQDQKSLRKDLEEDLSATFLVLDELASYNSKSSWFFRYVAQFIDDRFSLCVTKSKVNRFRQTIFISNVSVKDLEDWDPRSADRIRGLTLHWNLDHDSRR
jgi:hypothetical protein